MREEILKAFENEEFAKKVMQMETKEEVVKALNDQGLTPTAEEITELGSLIREIVSKLETLPDKELESIAGGVREAGGGGFWEKVMSAVMWAMPVAIDQHNKNRDAQVRIHGVQAGVVQGANQAKVDTAKYAAYAKIAQSGALATIAVAAATSLYIFRKEIKNFWFSED